MREDGGCEGQEQEQREEQGEDRGKVLDVEEEARRVVERLKREEQETGTAASILVELEYVVAPSFNLTSSSTSSPSFFSLSFYPPFLLPH